MSLDLALKEIKEDITFSNESINLDDSLKIQDISMTISGIKKYSINSIDTETKKKITNFLNLIIYKNNISFMNKIDKKIAMEVFTMLPNVPKVMEAKLTSAPSLINKEIVEKVLNTELEFINLSSDILEKLYNNISLLEEVKEKIKNLKDYLINFYNILNNKIEKLIQNPLLIVVKLNEPIKENDITIHYKTLNLIESPINEIFPINDTILDYENFRGKLSDKYFKIYNNHTLDLLLKLCTYCKQYNKNFISLKNINEIIKYITFKELENITNLIDNYILELNKIKENKKINDKLLNIINLNEEIVEKLELINNLSEIYNNNENVFKKIEELLEIL